MRGRGEGVQTGGWIERKGVLPETMACKESLTAAQMATWHRPVGRDGAGGCAGGGGTDWGMELP